MTRPTHHEVNTLGPSISPTPCVCQEANSSRAAKAKTGHQLVGSSIPCVYSILGSATHFSDICPFPPLIDAQRSTCLCSFVILFCFKLSRAFTLTVPGFLTDSLSFNTRGPSSVIPHLGLVFLHCTKYYISHNIMNLLSITIWSDKWVPIANKAENCSFRQIHGTRYIHGITRPIG